jgi:Ca2+-binding RTX toxin-like protein
MLDFGDAAFTNTIKGEGGSDILLGSNGIDRMWGGDQDDLIIGYDNSDFLYGDAHADVLIGGRGNDTLDGGPETADRGDVAAFFVDGVYAGLNPTSVFDKKRLRPRSSSTPPWDRRIILSLH